MQNGGSTARTARSTNEVWAESRSISAVFMNNVEYTPPPTVEDFIKCKLDGELFYSYIVGPYGPVSGDTEYLTPSGWKPINKYVPGEKIAQWTPDESGDPKNGRIEFVDPDDYIVTEATEFIHFKNKKSLSMMLSPNHRVPLYGWDGKFKVMTAAEAAAKPSKCIVPTAFVVDRPGTEMSEALLRLGVAINADGHFPPRSKKCIITVRKERKKRRIRHLLDNLGITYDERTTDPNRLTETRFLFESPYVGKHFDSIWWDASTKELEIILAETIFWDGAYESDEQIYFSTSKLDADFIQYAAHAVGGRASISKVVDKRNNAWSPVYVVRIARPASQKSNVLLRKDTIDIERKLAVGSKQYCFSTKSSFFLARHADRIFVTGNSGKTTGMLFKIAYMAKLQDKDPRDGLRKSRAVVVRNTAAQLRDTTLSSWNYWFKDGQAGKWFATKVMFLLKFDDVECEVMFRALDTEEDVARVLSLEITFAVIDEFVQIPGKIIEALSGRCGRYPPKKDGGATNFGMWGASNPGEEGTWWHKQLVEEPPSNLFYFHQPSGLARDAENLENLPNKYYQNLLAGKSDAWIKQFVEAEWGYNVSGQPVVPTFSRELHVSKYPIEPNQNIELIIGYDPGLAGSALIFGQMDLFGRLLVFDEIILQNYGTERMIRDRLLPLIKHKYEGFDVVIAPDPAANSRSMSNETSIVQILKEEKWRKYWRVKVDDNNLLSPRLEAIEAFTTKITEKGPALRVDASCKVLIRALTGGWRYEKTQKGIEKVVPEKNEYSHPGDAFGYLCRYHVRYNAGKTRRVRHLNSVSSTFNNPYIGR